MIQNHLFKLNIFTKMVYTVSKQANCKKLAKPNLTYSRRWFQTSAENRNKTYIDQENKYAFEFIPKLAPIPAPASPTPVKTQEEFNLTLKTNFRGATIEKIVATFDQVSDYVIEHKIAVSDPRFDHLVDGLMDHCEELTDSQLYHLLALLARFPPTESISSRNFHDVWSCLDDICCWKMAAWTIETKLKFAILWHNLNLGRLSDYVFEVINYLPPKSHHLDRNQLLLLYFLINICRRKHVEFEFEAELEKHVTGFNCDELGVISMAYFKSKSRIKQMAILAEMIRKVTSAADRIHDIPLAAILKTLRYSQRPELVAELTRMLDRLENEVPRLSDAANLHLALMGTTLQLKHEGTLVKTTEKLIGKIESVRLKDIERILLANSMFAMDTALYAAAYRELHKSGREPEMVQYSHCVPCALHFLSLRGLYSFSLMERVLDEEWINEVYGKSPKLLPKEIFSLDRCIEIECPDYTGRRLSPNKVYRAAKWLTEFVPAVDQYKKLTLSEKYYLDVFEQVKIAVGGAQNVRHEHLLPHFSKADMVVCWDVEKGGYVEPMGFENYVLGDVKWACGGDKYRWGALVVLVPNTSVRGRSEPLGAQLMKARQLEKIGYKAVFVYWNEFGDLDAEGKMKYIENKVRDAISRTAR